MFCLPAFKTNFHRSKWMGPYKIPTNKTNVSVALPIPVSMKVVPFSSKCTTPTTDSAQFDDGIQDFLPSSHVAVQTGQKKSSRCQHDDAALMFL